LVATHTEYSVIRTVGIAADNLEFNESMSWTTFACEPLVSDFVSDRVGALDRYWTMLTVCGDQCLTCDGRGQENL